MWAKNKQQLGFTIVELLIVVVVIAILAAVTIVGFTGIQDRAVSSTLQSDLRNAATLFELKKVEVGSYPTTMPSETKTSSDVVLQAADTGSADSFCINAYHKTKNLRLSWDSNKSGWQDNLCNGATIGTASGGTVPITPRGVNVAQDFTRWTLTGGATYNNTTKEMTLGATGKAVSPLIRIDRARYVAVGGDTYAVAPAGTGCSTAGCYHTEIAYYAANGTTLVTNTDNYTNNGCAQAIPANQWTAAVQSCTYNAGPNIVYIRFNFLGSNSGYANPSLKIRNPLVIVTD